MKILHYLRTPLFLFSPLFHLEHFFFSCFFVFVFVLLLKKKLNRKFYKEPTNRIGLAFFPTVLCLLKYILGSIPFTETDVMATLVGLFCVVKMFITSYRGRIVALGILSDSSELIK